VSQGEHLFLQCRNKYLFGKRHHISEVVMSLVSCRFYRDCVWSHD